MPSCGISFLNETEQTNETQTNFECFVQCALFLLQASAIFAEMAC